MSSLRRRAIWVQRARSIARSSTGGRASARTTAPASPGSASSRSQASRSRTSARWKKAAAPASRYGTARSSSAAATAWPSPLTERTSTQTSSGATPSRETSRSTSAATACACARSFAQRQNATSPGGAPSGRLEPLLDPVRVGRHHRGGRGEDPPARAQALGQPHDARLRPLGAEVDDVLRRRAAEAGDRRVVVGGDAEVAVVGHEQPQQQVLGEVRVLELVDEDVVEARREPCADVRLGAQEPERVEDEVARVQRAALRQQPVVRGVDGGELALAHGARAGGLAVLRQRGGPGGVVRGGHQLVLEPVDPADDRAEHRARVPAQVVRGERQLVDPLEQQREPVGGGDRRHERVDARLERLLAQQPRAERLQRGHRQLLEAGPGAQPLLDLRAQRVGGGGRVGQHEDRVGRRALLDEPGEALDERARLAGPGAREDQQRAARVRDRLELGRGRGHLRRIRPVSVAAPDWLGAARAAARELQDVLAAAPTTVERERETGTRGEGGDRTLEIDAAAEAAVFRRLEALHADGHRFAAVSEERGRVDFGGGPRAGGHRSARRLAQRQARAAALRALDRRRGRADDGRRAVRVRARLRRGRGVGRRARRRRPAQRRAARPVAARAARPRPARAARPRVRRPALGRRGGRRARRRGPPAAGDRRDRGVALPGRGRAGWTGWSRCAARARSTSPPAS